MWVFSFSHGSYKKKKEIQAQFSWIFFQKSTLFSIQKRPTLECRKWWPLLRDLATLLRKAKHSGEEVLKFIRITPHTERAQCPKRGTFYSQSVIFSFKTLWLSVAHLVRLFRINIKECQRKCQCWGTVLFHICKEAVLVAALPILSLNFLPLKQPPSCTATQQKRSSRACRLVFTRIFIFFLLHHRTRFSRTHHGVIFFNLFRWSPMFGKEEEGGTSHINFREKTRSEREPFSPQDKGTFEKVSSSRKSKLWFSNTRESWTTVSLLMKPILSGFFFLQPPQFLLWREREREKMRWRRFSGFWFGVFNYWSPLWGWKIKSGWWIASTKNS